MGCATQEPHGLWTVLSKLIIKQKGWYCFWELKQQQQQKKGPERVRGGGWKPKESHIPGSKGHSFSLANSAGVFPVRTQFELRSIMGILWKNKRKYHIKMVTGKRGEERHRALYTSPRDLHSSRTFQKRQTSGRYVRAEWDEALPQVCCSSSPENKNSRV